MGALDGVRVIDFGQYIAGPLAAMLLGDQGADVVRVDPPGGPKWDTPANATWNRNKRSVTLDLKAPADVASAKQLIAGADVVVENFRPGVMERLGLGHAAMGAANPGLVYCSLPGFAGDDPRAGLAAWEGVVGAASGMYARAERPLYTAIPIASAYAAFIGVTGVAMALSARGRDGLGQRVEVPLYDAVFAAIGYRGQRVHNAADGGALAAAGAMMGWTRQIECKDGRYVQFHAGNSKFVDFAQAMEAVEWAPGPDLVNRIDALFKTRTAKAWEDFSEAVGTECSVCHTSAEWLEEPHARQSEMIVEVDDPRLGKMLQPGVNVRMSATPGSIRRPAAATAGADTAAVRAELATARPVTPAAKAPSITSVLDGVKVLDLCIVLAGPTCGRTLAEFGAHVIKIDNPVRGGGGPGAFHIDVNRGKHSILIDLKKPGKGSNSSGSLLMTPT